MTDLKHNFITWYFNEFAINVPVYAAMEKTVEGSPWHRESSVAVHTNMVVAHFVASVSKTVWDRDDVCHALSLAFHDVGKPDAKTEKFSEKRGKYFRFSGHEQKSARLWEDYACTNWKYMQELFDLQPRHIYKIGWMIEYHKPWDIKRPDKLKKLALTINKLTWIDAFGTMIMADTLGRIQDDRPASIEQATNWIDNMSTLSDELTVDDIPPVDESKPELCMLIGPSGAGKSTWMTSINLSDCEHYSWDVLRHKWYDADDYSKAFELSCDDKGFIGKTQSEFIRLLKIGNNIVVDNTNLGNKRRNFFITEAKKRGYRTRAILFPISSGDIFMRQQTREDKCVPDAVVINQYLSMQYPLYGDYDVIDICGDNLPA